jgi:antibiotic biosynthesis monooxygenase (ABM) superfamily enzyme
MSKQLPLPRRRLATVSSTVFITHQVREGRQADYEKWANKIAPLSKASPGLLERHIVRPIPGVSDSYTVVLRFDTQQHLQEWMQSPIRSRLIETVQPLFVDFWFMPESARARAPVRWKQYLVTWSAIYPLVLGITQVVRPLLPSNHLLTTLVVTGIAAFLMVYLVMPRYTKLIQRWLFT